MNFLGQRSSLLLTVTMLVASSGGVWPGSAWAMRREMTDAEMDQVCAKGSTGFDVDLATIHEMVMTFAYNSAATQVAGSILWRVEANTADPARVQVLLGSQPVTPNASLTTQTLQPIQIRAIDAAVRVTGDLNISIRTSAAITRALEHQQAVLARFGGLRH